MRQRALGAVLAQFQTVAAKMALRSRADEVGAFLRVCEKVALRKELPLDVNQYKPEDVDRSGDFGEAAFEAHAFSKTCRDLAYYSKRAAALWKPPFLEVLGHATSLRVRRPSAPLAKAAGLNRCMACGRPEHRNLNVLDLAGPRVAYEAAWLCESAGPFAEHFDEFLKEYRRMGWEEGFVDNRASGCKAHCCDLGSYAVGRCCERKAALFFHHATLPLLHAFDARAEYEALGQKSARERAEYVYTTPEQVAELERTLDALKACLVDEGRAVPRVPADVDFWEEIDEARRAAGDERKQLRAALAVARSHLTVAGGAEAEGAEADDAEAEADDAEADDAEAAEEADAAEGARDSEAEDAESDMAGSHMGSFVVEDGPSSATRGAKRGRRVCESESDDDDDHGRAAPPRARRPASAPRVPSGFSAASFVQGQRCRDRIPARRDAVRKLYELAARLSQEHPARLDDAALCGHAAATIAELAERAGSNL